MGVCVCGCVCVWVCVGVNIVVDSIRLYLIFILYFSVISVIPNMF